MTLKVAKLVNRQSQNLNSRILALDPMLLTGTLSSVSVEADLGWAGSTAEARTILISLSM